MATIPDLPEVAGELERLLRLRVPPIGVQGDGGGEHALRGCGSVSC